MSAEEFTRYYEMPEATFRDIVEQGFEAEYRKGWVVTAILPMPDGNWLIKWDRDPFTRGTAAVTL